MPNTPNVEDAKPPGHDPGVAPGDDLGRRSSAAPITALYVHVPFCQTLCGYCDFFSVLTDKTQFAPLVDALLAELDGVRTQGPVAIETIFVGGGTPTTLPPSDLERLVRRLHEFALATRRGRAADLEFTVEANPATVTQRSAEILAAAGVTRVSIGAQSFDPSELRVLDRIHHPQQVADTLRICRSAGLTHLNLDLIFGIPGQSLESWRANLLRALELGPEHLSCYGLTYEPGTPLHERRAAGMVRKVDDETEAAMYEATIRTLADAGLRQYEISNFARPGCECRHNLVYWRNLPYLAIGPSGSGNVDGVRYKNIADVAEYIRAIRDKRSPRVHTERPTLEQQIRETLLMGLRLNDGVDRAAFRARFGRDPVEMLREVIERCETLGVVACDDRSLRLTDRGRLIADAVIAELA
ncbi:MAG: radical SAM family heme chaperone HemW [Planctomycetes bacterium]|nr:radical SAM family heme chaperone HemW [Planctomycetota bacterium]